ncbi:MAG: hypothetical protein L6R35_002855 [Caloplaca aegaea]|nr:MAG: hypothetical protein L6R35_002855 [Caloplaca aegaea]
MLGHFLGGCGKNPPKFIAENPKDVPNATPTKGSLTMYALPLKVACPTSITNFNSTPPHSTRTTTQSLSCPVPSLTTTITTTTTTTTITTEPFDCPVQPEKDTHSTPQEEEEEEDKSPPIFGHGLRAGIGRGFAKQETLINMVEVE